MTNGKRNYHLIDDQGIHSNHKPLQTKLFVALCHTVSLILICLGIAAIIAGYM